MKAVLFRSLLAFLLSSPFTACFTSLAANRCIQAAVYRAPNDSINPPPVSYHVLACPGGTYGYDILFKGKPLIRQTSIPCLQGNTGFASKKDAALVARLVTRKIKKGIMPPTVTLDEMRSLGVHL